LNSQRSNPRSKSESSIWHRALHRWRWLRHWLRPNPDPLTLLVMTRGHLEVEKIHLSTKWVRALRVALVVVVFSLLVSSLIFINFLVTLPERHVLENENKALRSEINKIQFHLDNLQFSVDKVQRFDKKLRALTEVDKEFARARGPLGQGGSESEEIPEGDLYDFGDFRVESSELQIGDESVPAIDRRQQFIIQRLFARVSRLYRDAELQNQSVEELFEVLKGRKLQLSATPSIMPVRGWVTSHFGYREDPFSGRRAFHKGMDIAAREGAPVLTPAEGVVTFAGPNGTYGNTVKVFHGYGISTLYAHLEDVFVRVGQRVGRGESLATVGNTGRSTSTHLHYEVQVHGVRVDPRRYILDRSL
jgi:murein DD-endopeptidase MepM/ murein hydrolase activator NlpD